MFSVDRSQLPCGLKAARLFNPITRCGNIGDHHSRKSEFKTYRDIFADDYQYVVPIANTYIPDYVRRPSPTNLNGRLSQKEVEKIVLTRINNENVMLQGMFDEASKQNNGYITKSDLYAIIINLCPQMNYKQFEEILRRCDLDKYTVFFFDTINRQLQNLARIEKISPLCDVDSSFRRIKGTNALHRLRVAAMNETFDLKDLLPPSVFEPNGVVLMPQLREALCRIDIRLTDTEFLRFWEKFDKFNLGSIPTKFLLQMLNLQDNGLPMCGMHSPPVLNIRQQPLKSSKRPPCNATHRCLVRPEKVQTVGIRAGGISFPLTRITGWEPQGCGGKNEPDLGKGTRYLEGLKSLMKTHPKYDSVIDKLCYIFQAPYHAMLVIFHHYDQRNRGKVSISESMEIFLEYGFSIIWKDFFEFLKRAGCIFDHSFVKYQKLMDKYQNKQELSHIDRAIKLIIQTQYEDIGLKTLTTMSPLEIEHHLIKLLHGPYIKLMEELQKHCDKQYTVEPQVMRSAIERLVLGETIRNDQWENLLPFLDIDKSTGRIPYKKFLYIFSKPSDICKPLCPQLPLDIPTKAPWDTSKYEREPRDLLLLSILIEKLLKRKFHFIDKFYKYWEKNDMQNFTEAQFHELLFSEKLEMTPTEIRLVWNVLLAAIEGPHSYQTVMQFMMSKLVKAARAIKIKEKYDSNKGFYDRNIEVLKVFKENQLIEKRKKKELVEKKISSSLMEKDNRSVTENIANIIESLKPIVRQEWERIKSYFIELDIIGSTTIENHQMRDLCVKIFPQLSSKQVYDLINKFDAKRNGRFDYIAFLMEFQVEKQENTISTKFDPYMHKMVDQKSEETLHMVGVRELLRKSMLSRWKNLLSAFRRLDVCKIGLLEISQVNQVLKLNKVFLKDDDLYHILTNFDKDMDGKIDYFEFIREILDINLVVVK